MRVKRSKARPFGSS
ncbi:hypothetical protein YPPY72_1171, partial [Yersinia pestis PY-72]